jgi:uncharacterized hydrophobic protein (TIGR00271 family)
MLTVDAADIERMTGALFIDGGPTGRASTRFWVLLILAGVIATAGVIADSTATVIGAMIVAPLMTPILGTALSLVLADRAHLLGSIGHVIGGALVVIAIGVLFGLIDGPSDAYASNSQVAARISPRLIDLIAATATGMVGAFALVRSDISDTLPGVAIAISLVPPLAVVGLLISVGRVDAAAQAGLLFGTNVAAIIATGTIVLLLYKVRDAAKRAGAAVGDLRGRALAPVVVLVVLVSVPLALGSASIARDELLALQARPIADAWATAAGWEAETVEAANQVIVVTVVGQSPEPDAALLRQQLSAAGLADAGLTVRLAEGGIETCPAQGTTCSPAAPEARR